MINFIDIHTHHLEKDDNTFSIYDLSITQNEISEKRYISVGCHPWDIENYDLLLMKKTLEKVVSKENVLTIGECGFDRLIKTPIMKQIAAFNLHIKMAKEFNKPLIIHCVKAYSDLLEILKKENYNGKFILHNFNGNRFQIDSFLKFNSFFSFGKGLKNPSSKFVESLKYISVDKILLETDDSDYSISQIYFFASDLLNIPIEDLKRIMKQNFKTLFEGQNFNFTSSI